MNYFRFLAEETREWMAKLGVATLEELIGRTDLLELLPGKTTKQRNLNLQPILSNDAIPADKPHTCGSAAQSSFDKGELAERMVELARASIDGKTGGEFELTVTNCDRSIGARLSGEIAKVHGNQGMVDAPIVFRLKRNGGAKFWRLECWRVAHAAPRAMPTIMLAKA